MNDKVMTSVMFAAAISLSCIAAWYSIAGLTAIFAAAVVPIIIMGGILEVSKLVVASWLYRNWEEVPNTFKTYFTAAVVILMMITSMGIFGFLSKAHLDQAVPAGDVTAQVSIYDDKIKTERDNIDAARKALAQMDAQIDQKLSRSTDEKGADKAIQIRRSQSSERKKLQNEISESQKTIVKLQTERAPIASQARKIEAEVGPIKYIAALIYGDTLDANVLEKAVRWVIIMIVLVFDPLAVLMLVAVNWSLKKRQPEVEPENIEPWINYPIDLPKKKVKPKKRKWLEKEPDPTPLPEAADWVEDTHYDPNEYVSPAKTIEEEVDALNKPLNSLDRLNKKYGDPNS
jgi:flagellar basal body-associated protein FliL